MRISGWFLVLLLGVAMMAAPAGAQEAKTCAGSPELVRWTIQKIKIVNKQPCLYARGSNKQYIDGLKITGKVDDLKYHFWCEEHWQLSGKHFDSRTFTEGFRKIISEREKNTPLDVTANILAVNMLEAENKRQDDEYRLKPEHFTGDHRLNEELMAKVTLRLAIISNEKLAAEKAVEAEVFVPLPQTGEYARLVVVEKATGTRRHVLLRSDNDPTILCVK